MHKNHHDSPSHNPGYETRDVKGKQVFWSLAVLSVITVICIFIAVWIFNFFDKDLPSSAAVVPSVAGKERILPPEPRLQAMPPLDLKKYNADQLAAVTTYGWVDKNAQRLHVPIELAIDLTAQRGLPHINPGDPLPAVTPPAQAASPAAASPAPAANPAPQTPPAAPSAGAQ
ncbi:MAG: hypothetical protein K1Y02_17700 [Candidatus Hydrogenedentes bacterium]|nr:hypothetical protein [Candidatus Hydrogenedentota bacterium]